MAEPLRRGDRVRDIRTNRTGTVLEVRGERVKVQPDAPLSEGGSDDPIEWPLEFTAHTLELE